MVACLAQHRDPYFGEHMGLWGGHTQVVDRTSQRGPGKEVGQTWSRVLYCTHLLHKDLLGLVLGKRAHFFGLHTRHASKTAEQTPVLGTYVKSLWCAEPLLEHRAITVQLQDALTVCSNASCAHCGGALPRFMDSGYCTTKP